MNNINRIAVLIIFSTAVGIMSAVTIPSLPSLDGWANFNNPPLINFRPVIGVLAQEQWLRSVAPQLQQNRSFISASYIKFLEGGGARVVPIFVNRSRSYYEVLMGKINGVLLPGGAGAVTLSQGYMEAAENIFDTAKKLNDEGIYFPLWGTCLGFQALAIMDASSINNHGRIDIRAKCSAYNHTIPLDFTIRTSRSRLFGDASEELLEAFKTEPLFLNIHGYCLTKEILKEQGIDKNWRVLTTNLDRDGFKHISSYENTKYPFYGVQFHPEKATGEFKTFWNIPHTENAVDGQQHFAAFFVIEARKNPNRFENKYEEARHLIYGFPLKRTNAKFVNLVQADYHYSFPADVKYPDIESILAEEEGMFF